MKIVNFLDITLNLNNGKYYPYRKPNDHPVYVHRQSNHPPTIIKHLPSTISRRLSDISCDEDAFKKAAPYYESALKKSGYAEDLVYISEEKRTKKQRKRNIIWFNPHLTFSKNVKTNIGRTFLLLIMKHFPPDSKLNKIFKKGNVKVSYGCMKNMTSIIKSSNNKILEVNKKHNPTLSKCNCNKKNVCPLEGKCEISSVIYQAEVISDNKDTKIYIGLTENAFKIRMANHKQSFNNRGIANSTELSKCIWKLKDGNNAYDIKWSILTSAAAYKNTTKICDLCLTEKLCIINATKSSLLNKRSELISKCRHENKYYLMNYNNSKGMPSISNYNTRHKDL